MSSTYQRLKRWALVYNGADDPQLLSDLRTVLRHWSRADLGDVPLVHRLKVPDSRPITDGVLCWPAFLKQAIQAGLARLRAEGQGGPAELLERRYLRGEGIYRLCGDYYLSERSLYYRLEQALTILAHAVWAQEWAAVGPAPAHVGAIALPPHLWRARHLPPTSYDRLFGVDELLARLLACVEDPGGCPVISLEGMGGLGKTALAREAAGRFAHSDRFADIAWLTAPQENDPGPSSGPVDYATVAFEQLLAGITDQLKVGGTRPLPLSALREGIRSLLSSQSCLVVVDNLDTATTGWSLPDRLSEVAGCSKFLLTSRHRSGPSAHVTRLALDELAETEALALVRHEALRRGLEQVSRGGDEVLAPILAAVGGNPLALKLIVGQLVSLPMSRVLGWLKAVTPDKDPFYQHLYRRSWQLLSERAKGLLRCVALLPAAGAGWEDLEAISGLAEENLAETIDELTASYLLQSGGIAEKSYTIHPLTRHFVQAHAASHPALEQDVLRIGQYWSAYAARHRQDWPLLARRQEHLLAAIGQCAATGPGRHLAIQMAITIAPFALRRGCVAPWESCLKLALAAAAELGDEAAQADLWNQLALLQTAIGQRAAALRLHQQAAGTFDRLGDRRKQAQTWRWQGNVYYGQPDLSAALRCYQQALDLLTEGEEPEEFCRVLGSLGNVYFNQGNLPEALARYQQVLSLLDREHDPLYVATVLDNTGLLLWQMGRWCQAVDSLLRAQDLQSEIGDRMGLANTHHYLCLVYADLEQWNRAFDHGRRAQALRQELLSAEGLADLYTDLATLHLRCGNQQVAAEFLNRAEPLWQEANRAGGLGRVWLVRGEIHARARRWHDALAGYRQAVDLIEPKTDHVRYGCALLGLADAQFHLGDGPAAEATLARAGELIQTVGRADLAVQLLWLRAEWADTESVPFLQAALELCVTTDDGNDRLSRLRHETQARLDACRGASSA